MNHELQNIPAFWIALSHWLACMLYAKLSPRLGSKTRTWIVACVLLPLQVGVVQISIGLHGPAFRLLYAILALLCAVPGCTINRLTPSAIVYYCARGFILGEFAASLAWQLYLFFQYIPEVSTPSGQCVFMSCVYAVIYIGMAFLELRNKSDVAEIPIQPVTSISTVFIAVLIYALSNLSFWTEGLPFTGSTYTEAFNIRTLIGFGGVSLLYANHFQYCKTYIQNEVTTLNNLLNMQYANYCVSEESIELINQKYHDLKHQIDILRQDSTTGQKSLERMAQEIQAYELQNKTGNHTLDVILASKHFRCHKLGARLNCVVDGAALNFLDVMDLSSLFGNALDNAIESVSKLSEPEQRLIRVKVKREKGFVRVLIENRCDDILNFRHGIPRTTKGDYRFHGFGLKSIRSTAEKYGGSMTLKLEHGWFELRILFPVQSASITTDCACHMTDCAKRL